MKFISKHKVELSIFVLGLIFINLIFLSEAFRGTTIDKTSAGQLGDFVGGYIGTIFALTSVLLLFVTLKSQIEVSHKQSFENKFFELLKMHRDNIAELELQNTKGRKIFVLITREFREILVIVRDKVKSQGLDFDRKTLMQISYYILFFGTGPNSSRMLKKYLSDFDCEFILDLEKTLNDQDLKNRVKKERKLKYKPFEGHQSRLGHYYRHLYQLINYVDRQSFSDDEKYEYVKTVRAQLTTHEQAMLLLNSLTNLGLDWWHKQFMVKYKMVQNLPKEFFDSIHELDVEALFDKEYFEWRSQVA